MISDEVVVVEVAQGVAIITMNRPQSRNALHPIMIAALHSSFVELAQRQDINAIVLTGNGPAFSAGLDLKYLVTLDSGARVAYMRSAFALFETLYHLPIATIAAVNGAAVAGGFDLAVFCDIRTCVPNAIFAQPEIKIGVSQFVYPLYTIVGMGKAKELALTGDPISADEAYRIGLVNHVFDDVELMDKTGALARAIASRPRDTISESKVTANSLKGKSIDEAFVVMGDALDRTMGSESHKIALNFFI
ncbi:enoyl-CoA hydratase/isomerase family protein [Zhongshania aliphaticivorans]|uniref:enoyl-CoA hydratase/isomerase family protein n=1 Tax=Zhongshania aliphaticivorans TaxID=1470434 RepID=UPI0012E5A46B|nr:enoyl-CoA hydratase/isomerase family protein [Zhongshania aliphaticivorans]CAA0101367.1 Short-chain-enoyl-CoA hydratase [Zhongshania aliphaticivorans]